MFPLAAPVTIDTLLDLGGTGTVAGSRDIQITAISTIDASSAGCLCFCSATDRDQARAMVAAAAPGSVVVAGLDLGLEHAAPHLMLVLTPEPRRWFIRAVRALVPLKDTCTEGVHPMAWVSHLARIGSDVTIGPFASVEDGAEIGAGSVIGPGARIMAGVHIGARVSVQANAVIGMTGLACERDEGGHFIMLPHLAAVVIGDDTRIGPCTTVARGSLRDTLIGQGCIIGSQVNIGHNCTIGDDCFLSAGAVLAGSCDLGAGCWIAPGVTILNKVRLGPRTTVAIGAVVHRPSNEGDFLAGNPARVVPRPQRAE